MEAMSVCRLATVLVISYSGVLLAAEGPAGVWRAWVESPGGPVPFGLEIQEDAGALQAWIINGSERIRVPRAGWSSGELLLDIDYYDSRIACRPEDGASSLQGTWRKRGRQGWVEMPFRAVAGSGPRFASRSGQTAEDQRPDEGPGLVPHALPARYSVKFASETDPAVGIFESRPGGEVWATFLTTTGDYRYLAGDFDGARLRLSCFDGAHAFLFTADLQPDRTLSGDFWSGSKWHDTWTARPDPAAQLPDTFAAAGSTEPLPLASLVFTDLEGHRRALDDPALSGRVRIIEIFGSWCPNCRDATALLIELDAKYRSRGLSIVGLAFEYGDDPQRHLTQVKTYVQRQGVTYPVLIAGEADKDKAAQLFPALGAIRAFPTTIFLDAEGQVRTVHTGFSGPATGAEHERLRAEFEKTIEKMLVP